MDTSCRRLTNKVAVVTGSSEGIGYAIAERLAMEGARVIICSRKEQNVQKAVEKLKSQGLEVHGVVCHVGKADHRRRLFQEAETKYGGVDLLVCNAAVSPYFGPMLQTTESLWDKIFEVNLKSCFMFCQEAVPYMDKRGGGSIVLVSSIGGYAPDPTHGAYGVSKTALFGLIRALTPELSGHQIRINCLAPGMIKTRFSEPIWQTPEIEQRIVSGVPMGRLGESEDCVGAVAFLLSDDAKYVTGETIVVAGGMNSRL